MKELGYNQLSKDALEQLKKGVFLTVKHKDKVNTMTIAWGTIGFMWNKPIFTVMVRPSRHTYEMIELSKEFTVSMPIYEDMRKALNYCGTTSGKDNDKIRNLGLTLVEGQKVSTPIIGECSLHYECRIVARQALKPDCMLPEIDEKAYNKGDYHTMFYGEIVSCYLTTVN